MMKRSKGLKRTSSFGSLSSASSYISMDSNISTTSALSTTSSKVLKVKGPSSVNAIKRIKGHLSERLKKGQRLASSMMVLKRSRRDMSVIKEDSVIDDEDPLLDVKNKKSIYDEKMLIEFCDFEVTIPNAFDFDGINEDSFFHTSNFPFLHNSDVVNGEENDNDIILFDHGRSENETKTLTLSSIFASKDEISDLTPRTVSTSIDYGFLPSPDISPKDSMNDENMMELTPRSRATFIKNKTNRHSFHFDDETLSLTSFQTVRTVERLINNPTSSFIFLLLLQIETKKFEIIKVQLPSYNISYTIGDILNQIAIITTDSTLAEQRYRGLCRPSTGIEMTNLTDSAIDEDGECRIVRGEVLVAIPEQRISYECIRASQSVFWNIPAIDNLFQDSDPFSPPDKSCDESIDTNETYYRHAHLDHSSPVGMELSYSEDHVAEVSSKLELKSLDASEHRIYYEAMRLHGNNTMEAFSPGDKLPNLQHFISFPIRTFQNYEQYLIRLVQKQISMKSQQNAKMCARVLVKGSKMIVVFLSVRRMIIGTLLTTSGASNVIIVASTDPFGIVGFVEFVLFLVFLIWYQKRSNIKRMLGRSSEPRRIELWG